MLKNLSGILTGPKVEYDIPKGSMGKYIFQCLKERDSNNVINTDVVTKDVLTCGRLLEDSVKLSTIFETFKVQKGDVVTMISENTINYCVPALAALYKGIILNPLNPAYSTGELKHALRLSKPKLIMCSKPSLQKILEVKEELDFAVSVLLTESRSETNPEINCIQDLLQETVADTKHFVPDEFDYQQDAYIFLSSGTTGLPKGVLVTHRHLREFLGYFRHTHYGNMTSNDVTIHFLPFFHLFGLFFQMVIIVTSLKSLIMHKFQPDIFLSSIQSYKVTKFLAVPPILLFFTQSPMVQNYDVSSLKDIIVGAAPLKKDLQEEFKKRFKAVTVRQGYGLTETCMACMLKATDNFKPESVGVLVPGMTAKVWNPDTNEILGPHKTGELCFKGPTIMKGYIANEEATRNCIDEDGFYHTGDVGYYDEDRHFYVVDRIKELIKYKGFQVPPAELEALIMTHSSVKDCGIIGIPDERAGQLPLAFVVKKNGINLTKNDIVDYVSERISVQKRLYGGVIFVEEIPKNSMGKILRRKLLELYQTLQCSKEAIDC